MYIINLHTQWRLCFVVEMPNLSSICLLSNCGLTTLNQPKNDLTNDLREPKTHNYKQNIILFVLIEKKRIWKVNIINNKQLSSMFLLSTIDKIVKQRSTNDYSEQRQRRQQRSSSLSIVNTLSSSSSSITKSSSSISSKQRLSLGVDDFEKVFVVFFSFSFEFWQSFYLTHRN